MTRVTGDSFMTGPVHRVPVWTDRFVEDGRSTVVDATVRFEATVTNS